MKNVLKSFKDFQLSFQSPFHNPGQSIKDNETFVLNLDRHEYTGTWQALKRDTASYEIELELSSETGVGEDYKFKTIELEYWKDGMNDINEPCWQLTSRLWYYNPDEVKQEYHCSFYMTEKKN